MRNGIGWHRVFSDGGADWLSQREEFVFVSKVLERDPMGSCSFRGVPRATFGNNKVMYYFGRSTFENNIFMEEELLLSFSNTAKICIAN